MKVIALVLLLGLLCMLNGCSTIANSLVNGSGNAYAGNYTGTCTTSYGQTGTITLVIGTDGTLGGSEYNSALNQTGAVTGSISDTGVTALTVTYSLTQTSTETGIMALNTSGQLQGTLTQAAQSGGGTVTITLTRGL